MCSADLFPAEIQNIKKLASWNGYPKSIRNAIIKRTLTKPSRQEQLCNYNDMIKCFINLPYMANAKRRRNIRKEVQVKFVVTYNATELSFFTNTKDHITKLGSSFVVYHFRCPGCHHNYIGKTEKTLWERINEHGYRNKNSVIYNHIINCEGMSYLVDLLNINNNSAERQIFDTKTFGVNIVKQNTCIIDKARQRDILLFKEALKIKEKCPTLNKNAFLQHFSNQTLSVIKLKVTSSDHPFKKINGCSL